MSSFHYMLDLWHARDHSACPKNPADAAVLDPRHEKKRAIWEAVNTEACEQAFSFIDRVTYVSYAMAPGLFHVYGYLIMDMENTKVVKRRARGAE